MRQYIDYTQGPIFFPLVRLAVPLSLGMLLEMVYTMIDMIWLGRIGNGAVAAVGTAGFFTWLGAALMGITKIGLEVCIAQSIGMKDSNRVNGFIKIGIFLSLLFSFSYCTALWFFAPKLIPFFNLGHSVDGLDPTRLGITYLRIIAAGGCLFMVNPIFAATFNGRGLSYQAFRITAMGLLLNLFLDPLLIFGFGPLPALGTRGAAFATVIGQLAVLLVFLGLFFRQQLFVSENKEPLGHIMEYTGQILKIGFPASIQNVLFSLFAMAIAKILSQWGPGPIAVQKIGASVEAFSWATAFGFSSALGVFVGQNYGSLSFDRVLRGYHTVLVSMAVLGVLTGCAFMVFSEQITDLFLEGSDTIRIGKEYFFIIGLSQSFMCIEITVAGAFSGFGHTVPPAVVSIVLNASRIPMALYLSSDRLLGLNGVWWALSLTSLAKGVILMLWFSSFFQRFYRKPSHHKGHWLFNPNNFKLYYLCLLKRYRANGD